MGSNGAAPMTAAVRPGDAMTADSGGASFRGSTAARVSDTAATNDSRSRTLPNSCRTLSRAMALRSPPARACPMAA